MKNLKINPPISLSLSLSLSRYYIISSSYTVLFAYIGRAFHCGPAPLSLQERLKQRRSYHEKKKGEEGGLPKIESYSDIRARREVYNIYNHDNPNNPNNPNSPALLYVIVCIHMISLSLSLSLSLYLLVCSSFCGLYSSIDILSCLSYIKTHILYIGFPLSTRNHVS